MSAEGRFETLLGEAVRAFAAVEAAIGAHLKSADGDAAQADRLLGAYRLVRRAADVLGGDVTAPERGSVGDADDLTRIRGVDASAARRLGALGIVRFEQMAAWEAADVAAVALALDLGADFAGSDVIGQARRLVVVAADGAVSSWCGRPVNAPNMDVEPADDAPNGDALVEIHAVLRRGPPKAELRPLCALAPALARRVPVCERRFVAAVGVPWAPRPLIAAEIPGVPASKRAASRAPAAEPTADERLGGQVAGEADTPPSIDPRPLHERALDRIARLDAEIATFGRSETLGPSANSAVEAGEVVGVATIATAPETPAVTPHHALEVAEAEVEIGVRSGVTEVALEPIPELPLRVVRRPVVSEFRDGGSVEVAEAAVVIVKRRSRERAAPDLAFYNGGEVA